MNNRTIQKDRAVLHRIFEIAEQLELRDGNPVSRVSAPKADGRDPIILSAEQYEALLRECTDRPLLWLYTLTLGEGGLRCESEALRPRHARAGDRIGSMRVSFRSAARRAKLPAELHQHDLRHRRVTTWLAEGRDVVKVKEALGHADLRTTMGYAHLAREHLKGLVDDRGDAPAKGTSAG